MSSGKLHRGYDRHYFVQEEAPEDLVGESSAQHPERFFLRVAASDASVHVGAASADSATLGDRDAMERRVDLAVPAAIESEVRAAAPHGDGCRPGPASKDGL